MKCMFILLQIYMFKMSMSIEISAKLVEENTTGSSFLWCYPFKKLDKKGLQGSFSYSGLLKAHKDA